MKAENIVEFALVFEMEARAAFLNEQWPNDSDFNNFMKPTVLATVIEEIAKHARTIETLNLKACNVGETPGDEKRYDRAKEKIIELFTRYGIKPVFQGDPRGAAVGILCPLTKRYNSWGGEESGFRLNFSGR